MTARLLLRDARHRRGGAARALDRRHRAGDAPVARRARRPVPVPPREAARGRDARRRPDVPRPLELDDRRCLRAEHDDPQLLRAEHGLRDGAGAGEAAAGDPRGQHGRRQEALAPLLRARRSREDGHRRGDAHRGGGAPQPAHDARGPRRARLRRDARRDRLRDAVRRVHAGHDRGGALHRDRPGHRHGRDELDGPRHRRGRRRRLPLLDPHARASRSAPSAAGRRSPTPAPGSA